MNGTRGTDDHRMPSPLAKARLRSHTSAAHQTAGGHSTRTAKVTAPLYLISDHIIILPYAVLLALGGVAGYSSKGSLPSLLGGCGSGLVLAAASAWSRQARQRGRSARPACGLALTVAAALILVMGKRWHRTSRFMPARLVCVLSFAVCVLLLQRLLASRHQKQMHSV